MSGTLGEQLTNPKIFARECMENAFDTLPDSLTSPKKYIRGCFYANKHTKNTQKPYFDVKFLHNNVLVMIY
jgi:hypothetical protein